MGVYVIVELLFCSSSVKVIKSDKPGMGKSLHIKKLSEKLNINQSYRIVSIHGPVVNAGTVVQLLQSDAEKHQSSSFQIIHVDIDSEVLHMIIV